MAALSSITIDVDSLRFYRQIHGLEPIAADEDPIYTIALPRFFELLQKHRVPSTLFLIASDADAHRSAFAPVEATGSEVASHSYDHDYRLTRQAAEAIRTDLRRADARLRPLNLGRPLAGFRAPGYNISAPLLEAVLELGYRYDSSLLPAPLYFSARATAVGAYQLLGRPSQSLIGKPQQFFGPLHPYRCTPDRPWRRSDDGPLLELPMWVEPTSRFPLIGTSWPALPASVRRAVLGRSLRKLPFLNFEMHAIDLLDQSDHESLATLAPHQRDLARPVADKLEAFGELFASLASETAVRTLADVAAELGPS